MHSAATHIHTAHPPSYSLCLSCPVLVLSSCFGRPCFCYLTLPTLPITSGSFAPLLLATIRLASSPSFIFPCPATFFLSLSKHLPPRTPRPSSSFITARCTAHQYFTHLLLTLLTTINIFEFFSPPKFLGCPANEINQLLADCPSTSIVQLDSALGEASTDTRHESAAGAAPLLNTSHDHNHAHT
ncbi:hypothetical protein LZ32DRAFT_143428 [Colletotrichum eremochloae]|nr:hypothetical protein LZ32DRAFT_143428 [Colletotrichum eremochloae]